jgi:hypothetical protein
MRTANRNAITRFIGRKGSRSASIEPLEAEQLSASHSRRRTLELLASKHRVLLGHDA